jgi:hypothetical protein
MSRVDGVGELMVFFAVGIFEGFNGGTDET